MKLFINHNLLTILECTGLDPTWETILKTAATFPVAQGTTITLKCLKKRHVLFGDREVTCDKEAEYKENDKCKR